MRGMREAKRGEIVSEPLSPLPPEQMGKKISRNKREGERGGRERKRGGFKGYSDRTVRVVESLQSSAMCTIRVARPRAVPV
jgi:hypothetical protein